MTTLILFDIDGTLVLTGGAGGRAMTQAFQEVFGVPDGFAGIPMPGRTDDAIVSEAVARANLVHDTGRLAAFRARYVERLAQTLEAPRPDKRVMPGVVPLLEALGTRPNTVLGLLTGNYPEAARLKLEHFGLWRYFPFGAYGGEAPDRNGLVPLALERARAFGFRFDTPRDVLVVGDTPLDVACAHSAGAVAVAVATGSVDETKLLEAGADIVFRDLSDTARFLALLDGNRELGSGPGTEE
jgi:phosphoglycolate phosphatase